MTISLQTQDPEYTQYISLLLQFYLHPLLLLPHTHPSSHTQSNENSHSSTGWLDTIQIQTVLRQCASLVKAHQLDLPTQVHPTQNNNTATSYTLLTLYTYMYTYTVTVSPVQCTCTVCTYIPSNIHGATMSMSMYMYMYISTLITNHAYTVRDMIVHACTRT